MITDYQRSGESSRSCRSISDWHATTIGLIAEVKGGKRLPKGDKFSDGPTGFPYIRVTDFDNFGVRTADLKFLRHDTQSQIERYTISAADVYISIAGTIGLTGMIPKVLGGANLTENAAKLVLTSADVDPAFLMYFLASEQVQREIRSQTVKNAQPKLALARIASLEIRHPPLYEQRQIVAVLGLVRRAMDEQQRLSSLTSELKKVLQQQLFTEGIRRESKKQTEIGPLPESWELTRCEDLCEMITVGVVVRPASHYVPKGVPAFRSFNVREDRLAPDDLVYFSETDNNTTLAKSRLRAGDVLVVRTGYPGTSCVVPKEYDGANCIDLVIVRPKAGVISSGLLSRFFNSPAGKRQAISAKHGLAQQHLNVGAVKSTLIPVPPTLQEQEEIDNALSTVEQKLAIHVSKHSALTDLFRTLLHELMTARVRVHNLDLAGPDALEE